MEVHQYAAIVRRRLLLVIVAMGVAALGGYAATRGKLAIYTATTKLEAQQFIADPGLSYHLDLNGSQSLALNDAALATSYPILQQAAARDPNISGGAIGLAHHVQAAAIPDTAVFQISARASSPDQAVRSANAVAQAFVASTAAAQQAQFRGTRDNLARELGRLMIQIDTLEQRINYLQGHYPDAAQSAQLAALQNQQATLRAKYVTVQGILQQTIVSLAQPGGVVIVQPASLATVKSPLTPLLLTALAALGGAILGVGVAFLLYYVSDVLSTPHRVAQESRLPMLGSVVAFTSHRAHDLIALDSRASASEDYRLLGAHLSAGRGPRTVLITSPQRGDGKTTTVANLAVTLAEAGKSVIAVDANFLRPRLHSLFALANDKGVLDVLRNGSAADGDHCLRLTWTDRLRVLPAGSLDGNVRAPIAWPGMAQVLADLQQRADVVLVDSPAVLESADAALLATHIDDTIVVVDATRTKTTVLAAAQALLVRTGASIRGLLLNKVASQDRV